MVPLSPKICRSLLPLFIVAAMGAGCGDPQLNQSRREPFFVAQPAWSATYAPGLIVASQFPGLTAGVENPRFVSSDPAVVTASVIPGDSPFSFNGVPAVRLNTGAPGSADLELFDGAVLIHTESIQIARPTAWRFDFTLQNQVAPREAALAPDEAVQILDLARVVGVVEFSRGQHFSVDETVVATGRIDLTSDLLLELRAPSLSAFGAAANALRFNQLSSGDWVSIAPGGLAASVRLMLPNGQTLFPSDFKTTPDVWVEELEIVVARNFESGRADVAVYGVNESERVLGLSPAVAVDGVPLRRFAGQVDVGESSGVLQIAWLFELPPGVRAGTVEASWNHLSESVRFDVGGSGTAEEP
jgi:hypothetical protein